MSQAVVLLVEDEPALRQLFTFALQQENLVVLPTGDAAQALQVFRDQINVDLLLTDMQLDEMSGIDLAERISAEHPRIKVLIMSGALDSETLVAEKGYGFLAKPFSPTELKDRVLEVLGRKSSAQSQTKRKTGKMTG